MMNLKRIFPALLILFVLAFGFTSCEKEGLDFFNNNEDTEEITDGALLFGSGDEDDAEGNKGDCFTVNFPIEVSVAGSTETINSEEEVKALFEGMDEGDKKDFEIVFPIEVTMTEDGSVQTLEDYRDLKKLKKDCFGDWDGHGHDENFKDCFEVSYPISVVLEDGTTQEINKDKELFRLLRDCEDEDEGLGFEIVYPITVTMAEDGATVTLNNEDEVEDLLEECFD